MADRARAWRDRTLASPRFQAWASAFPLTRPIAARRTRALFDLCAGFVYAQVLAACVELDLFELLAKGPLSGSALARQMGLTDAAAERLLASAVSLRLAARRGADRYGLGSLGAAMVGNPAIAAMVRHHAMLYADLADPVSLLRGERGGTRLGQYWAYAKADAPADLAPDRVDRYSALMAASQAMIAGDILDAHDFRRHRHLLDVGGGEGVFALAVAARAPALRIGVFDLPAVAERARARFARAGVGDRVTATGGDFYRDALPSGADAASLVRVIHDHDDAAATQILIAARRALAPGGTLVLAEPMAGTRGAEPVGDAYFGFYLLAMGSGRPRTPERLAAMLGTAGFTRVREVRTRRPLLVRVMLAEIPSRM